MLNEEFDIDLEFSVLAKGSRKPYALKIKAWDMEVPCSVRFRLVKFKIGDSWEVLATNLPRRKFSLRELKKLYKSRWKIETAFRDLKHSLGTLHFHSRKDLFNLQEIYAHIIRYNLTTRIIQETVAVKTTSKYRYEVNFKNTCHIVKSLCRRELDYKDALKQIGYYLHAIRPNRHSPRERW